MAEPEGLLHARESGGKVGEGRVQRVRKGCGKGRYFSTITGFKMNTINRAQSKLKLLKH